MFLLCRRSITDPAFPRYPRLPVVECAGFERRVVKDARGSAEEIADDAEQQR